MQIKTQRTIIYQFTFPWCNDECGTALLKKHPDCSKIGFGESMLWKTHNRKPNVSI